MYCGTNALDRDVINGTKQLGTRYQCLKRGIGQGLSMEPDDKYLGDYQPLDDTKKYCGNLNLLPVGYDRFGTIHECHTTGIGAGRKLKAQRYFGNQNAYIQEEQDIPDEEQEEQEINEPVPRYYPLFFIISALVSVIVAIVCLVIRINEWRKQNEPIDWVVISLFSITILTSLGLLILVWMKYRNS